MPLLQDLLEACYFLAHPGEKTKPSEFDWKRVSPKNLRALEHKRKLRKKGGRASRERRAAAQERYRQRQKARIGEQQFNARRAREQQEWNRSENGARYAARLLEIQYAAARKAKERSKRLGEKLATLALAEIEAPAYIVVMPGQPRRRETWPLKDAAALWIAAHDPAHRAEPDLFLAAHGVQPPQQISTSVSKPLDTNPPSEL